MRNTQLAPCKNLGFWAQGLGFWVQGLDFWVMVQVFGFRDSVWVEEDVTLTIARNALLDIDFANHELRFRPRGRVYVQEGGRVQ